MIKLILSIVPSLLSLLNKLFDPVENRRKKAEKHNDLLQKYEKQMGEALAKNNIAEVNRLEVLMKDLRAKIRRLTPYVKKDTTTR